MTYHVIDTNVLAVANGAHREAGPMCVGACVEFLREVKCDGVIVLDSARRILQEYERNVRRGGQPRTGFQFYKWLRDTHRRRREVEIHPKAGPHEDYEEFPNSPELSGFDPADRKFVAVALASQLDPTTANATDRDWAEYHRALAVHGVQVRFLCPNVCAPTETS